MAQPHGIMFHHFHKPGEPFAQGSITAQTFAEVIECIGRKHILSAREWYERAVQDRLAPTDICLTFDDNLLCQYDIARPVMESYGLTGFFFIYSSVCEGILENLEIYRVFRTDHFDAVDDFYQEFEQSAVAAFPDFKAKLSAFRPDQYLTQYGFYSVADRRFRYLRDELLGQERYYRLMDEMIATRGLSKQNLAQNLWMDDNKLRGLTKKGHMVGLHSYSHPTRLCALSGAAQAEEYRKNYHHIQNATGVAPVSMSHPCNSYDAGTLQTLKDLGIRVGFCATMAEVVNRSHLEFPRRDHADVVKGIRA